MGAAAPAANAAAWAKCFATAAAQEERSEVQALVPILAALPAHERGGNVVTLFRRSLRDLDLGFALGAWRLLNKAQQQRGSTGTWSLSSPLRFAELEALLATLRVAQSAELREVLMELVEQSRCRPPLPSLAALWARGSSAAPCSEWRLHRVAQRGSAQRWREAKELAYFQQQQLPLVDPRSSSLRGLRVEQLEELLRGHAAYLQEPAFDEELQCHRRPSCWEFYAKVLKPACIPGRSFVELYLPQEVHLVVSHSWLEPLEDLLLALQRHAGHAQCQGLAKMIQPQRPWGYWLSLLSSGPAEVPEGQMASAMETAQQFLIAWDDAGRWSTRLWCLYELLTATRCQKPISITCRSGVLGRGLALAEQSRGVARRLISSDPRCAADDLEVLREKLGEAGFQALDRALLAAAAPLLCMSCTPVELQQSNDHFRPLMDALPPAPRCVILQAPQTGRHGAVSAALRRRLATATTLTVEMSCALLADLMESKGPGEEDLLKLWLDFTMGDTDLEVIRRYQKLLIVLEDLEDAGRHATSILTWARKCLAQPDVAMIIMCRGEEQKWTPEQLARMDPATYDLIHLSQPDRHGSVDPAWEEEPWRSAVRLSMRMTEDGQLWVSGCTVDALCIGRHGDLELLEAEKNCFEVYKNLVSKLLPPDPQQLEDFALELCGRGPPYVAPIPSSLRSCPLLCCHGAAPGVTRGRFTCAALRSFCAAQALRRRNDLTPQVISNQWPQVRHFLRRAVELDLRCPAEMETAVLRQKLKMARLLTASPSVLAPLLADPTETSLASAAAEALEAWLAEAEEAALPQLLAFASHVSPKALDPAVLQMARAKVRLQELEPQTVSLHEILLTLEACAVLPPKLKWPFAQRFLQQIKGRISGLEGLQLLIRLAAAAEMPETLLEEPLQEFLDASLPHHLAAATSLLSALPRCRDRCEQRLQQWRRGTLPQRRLGGGRYHSLLLQGGRVIAIGLNGQGETNVPALTELRYVAVAAGTQHSLLLRSDGVVTAFGLNLDGQTDVPPLPRPIVAVAAGGFHSVVLDETGHCWAFGCNRHGQCQLPDDAHGPVVGVAAGKGHTLALTGDGQVLSCGENGDGQCDVPDLFWESSSHQLKYIAIAAGGRHSVLLRNDGKAVGVGCNFHGQCDLPDSRFVSAACGENHTLLLCRQGQVVAVGDDGYGQCQVPQLPCGLCYVAIAAGHRHSLLLRSDGRVLALGDDGEGQCQIPGGLHMDDS